MKSLSISSVILVLIVCAFSLYSQNYIAVQHNSTLTQYTTLDAAIAGAQAGDYIYVPGGVYTLSTIINKKLFIYGAGHYPDSTTVTNVTQIQGNVTICTGADAGLISGIYITGYVRFGTSGTNQLVNSYTIQRCKIDSYLSFNYDISSTTVSSNGIYISENLIKGNIYGANTLNTFMEKNILEGYIQIFGSGGIFKNNIFLYTSSPCAGYNCSSVFGSSYAETITNCVFENNIIFDPDPLQSTSGSYPYYSTTYTKNCTFNNNLFIYNQPFPYQTNIGINNIVNQAQSSIFINQSGTTFSYSHDYHLKSTCPGKNAGTDGTDIGIYGTGQPYKAGAVPANPHIRQKIITIQNNQINVNIKVAAQDR